MKKFKKVVLVIVVIAVLVFCFSKLIGSIKPIVLETGWQKMESLKGYVPKGAIIVASEASNLILPGNSEMKERTGFIKQGTVFFYEKKYCLSEGSVWIYFQEDYEFLVKIDDFSLQCDEKLSDLTGKKEEVRDTYFVGHP